MKTKNLLLTMFLTFFKIGAFTFGGGFAMIPLIKKEVVDNKGWIAEEEFVDALGITQSAPGAVAINTAVYIGYRISGVLGAIVCVLGTVLPSFFIILLIASVFFSFRSLKVVDWVFSGIRPAVLALIVIAAVNIGKTVLKEARSIILFALALCGMTFTDIHPIIILVIAACLSCFLDFVLPKLTEPRDKDSFDVDKEDIP